MRKTVFSAACAMAVFFTVSCGNKDAASTRNDRDSAYAKLTNDEKRLSANALAGLEAAEGLEATLFASEPLIGNPTNIDVDAKGRVWMCETLNYRPQMNPDNPQRAEGDRILILEDLNGDGRADTSKVFYQGPDVNAALGIAVLGNKIIVSSSPNVLVFTDNNGDDIPDSKEILFTGLGGEHSDHAVHSFTFGPDGKLYFNFGNEGKQLLDKNGKPLKDKKGNLINSKGEPYRQGMVFRMNQDGTELEVLAHNFRNNYEAAIDSYGTIWQSDNDDDGNQSTRINYVMEFGNYGYTDEVTGAGWRSRRTNMETEIPKKHWHQNDPGSIPNLLMTGAGSPAGITFYEGTLLPKAFQNGMIHTDAGPNIVRAYPVQNAGAGYKASIIPVLEGARDQWFRPIDVCTAPDGSIFVADWYDPGVGGHQMGDLNRGRIYRIAPPKTAYKIGAPNLSTAEGAVQALQSPNGATKYLAWEKLAAMGAQAENALQKLWTSDNHRFRARALWVLSKLKGKENIYISQALKDKNPDIRITGLRAARQVATDIVPYVKQVVRDKDPQVRREAAIALHYDTTGEGAQLWADLAMQYDGADRWYLEALGVGADGKWDQYLAAWQAKAGTIDGNAKRDIVWRARTGAALPLLVASITDAGTDSASRLKYFRAFDFINDPSKDKILLTLLDHEGAHKEQIAYTALHHLSPVNLAASSKMKAVLNNTLDKIKGQQGFVDLVNHYKLKDRNADLFEMVVAFPDSSLGVEAANLLLQSGGSPYLTKAIKSKDKNRATTALRAIGRAGSWESMKLMESIIADKAIHISLRQDAVKMLGHGWMESEFLFDMMTAGKLSQELQPIAIVALSGSVRGDIKAKASKFGVSNKTADGKNLPSIQALAKLSSNSKEGIKIFNRICATCHKVGDEGYNFGPALTQIGSKLPKEALYTAILHPDAGISFGYEGYVFKMKDGSTMAGVIASETETDLEILIPGGVKKKFERASIASRTAMKNSMMPANLQQTMTQEELVSLVEYLHSLKK